MIMNFVVQISVTGFCIAVTSGDTPNCPVGYKDTEGFCYNYTGIPLPWDGAKTFCTQNGGHIMIEATPYEHTVFSKYRQTLAQQGDPLWVGIHVETAGGWSWLYDFGLMNPLYTNWQGGKTAQAPAGQCVATNEVNKTQVWQGLSCNTPLYFVCEAVSKVKPGEGSTPSTPAYLHGWKKVYPDSIYKRANVVANASMTRAPSLVSCAVTCSTVTGCAAFNHRRSDSSCQFILSEVPDKSYVITQLGWDVWVDYPPTA